MRKKHRGNNYKFTEKKHSKRGIAALFLALLSIVLGIAMTVISFQAKGNGTVYLGSAGIFSMLLALISFIQGLRSLREEESYKTFPLLGAFFGFCAFGGWVLVYIAGFMLS